MPVNSSGPLRFFDMGMSRFKRVGPNAMRGRGIGTARGRATIMRGLLPVFFTLTAVLMCLGSQWYRCANSSKGYVITDGILQLVVVGEFPP